MNTISLGLSWGGLQSTIYVLVKETNAIKIYPEAVIKIKGDIIKLIHFAI